MQNLDTKMELFNHLRETYHSFVYERYSAKYIDLYLELKYYYKVISNQAEEFFVHTLKIPVLNNAIEIKEIENIIFHIGMIESINYWKIFAPKFFIVECGNLDESQKKWFKKLFFRGLSEYLYLNQIVIDEESLMDIIIEKCPPCFNMIKIETQDKAIIPIGGGKDSIVSYEILKYGNIKGYLFSINPIKASQNILDMHKNNSFAVQRNLDAKILEYNRKGYLNGHIPFSSIIGFISILLGLIYRCRYIVLSNENSASEGNVEFNNIEVNHQYSKSLEFENDFRWYVSSFITMDVEYFSFLRPLDEITIAKIFSIHEQYFSTFLSCNVGSKQNKWCCNCPKCLFTYIMLCNYIEDNKLQKIFGKNLFEVDSLEEVFLQLSNQVNVKPFECVGTYDEVNFAIKNKIKSLQQVDRKLPYLLKNYDIDGSIYSFLLDFQNNHNLPESFRKLLQEYVDKIIK